MWHRRGLLVPLDFPISLVYLTWASTDTQYLWLGYQLYAVLAMHVARLVGWNGCGRSEETIAKILQNGKEAYLGGHGKVAIRAKLQVEECDGNAEGKTWLKQLLETNAA
jgi:hypothetical protein